jgi:uncharacterized protein (DUF4415 family)
MNELRPGEKTAEELAAMQDEDIDFSDIPEAGPEFWANAQLVMPQPKQGINIRIDADVLSWFKQFGKGYQTRMNAVLRSYMENHR